jgi:hypothetical protein
MPYPLDGSIAKMGLEPAEASALTPKAQAVTKQQILVLQDIARTNHGKSEAQIVELFDKQTGLSLSVADVSSIGHAFDQLNARRAKNVGVAADAACCCTCTPCCSCTASVVVESRV